MRKSFSPSVVVYKLAIRSILFQYRFEKRLNRGEWLYQTVLKRTRGNNTERERERGREGERERGREGEGERERERERV